MADAPVTLTSTLSSDTTAYEVLSYFQFRPQLYFPRLATVKPTNQSHRGASVQFTIYNDLASAVTPLTENADVTPVAVTDGTTSVTITEYGSATITSAKIRGTSFLVVSSDAANVIGFNMGKSFDTVARNVLLAGTNVFYANGVAGTDAGPRNTIATTDRLNSTAIRQIVAALRNNSVPPYSRNGGANSYMGFIAPDAGMDLRSETGVASWRDPHVYSKPEEIWNGEVGKYEDVIFVETERLWMNNSNPAEYPAGFQNGGAGGTVDVYASLFCGQQALAKAWSNMVSAPEPQIVIGKVIDILQRFVPIGWYWMGGFAIFRQAAVYRLEHSSSVGT